MADSDIGFPSDAYHDPNTGMYIKPEHVDGTEKEFTEHQVAEGKSIFLPRPRYKPCRMIQFATPHAYLEVIDSMDRVKELIDMAKNDLNGPWFAFTDPVYGTALYVHRDQLCKAAWVIEGFKDLDAVQMQLDAMEQNKQMAKLAKVSQRRLG